MTHAITSKSSGRDFELVNERAHPDSFQTRAEDKHSLLLFTFYEPPRHVQPPPSLSLCGVAGLGSVLGPGPPLFVGAVPLHRLGQTGEEVGVCRPPAELVADLGRVNSVATVVAGAVVHTVEGLRALPHDRQNRVQDVHVTALAIRAYQVCLTQTTSRQDLPHSRGVVVDVDSVAHVEAVAVDFVGGHVVEAGPEKRR